MQYKVLFKIFMQILSTLAALIFPSAILYLYARWLYEGRENLSYYLVPLGILGGCFLLAGLFQSYFFNQAIIASYTIESSWDYDYTWHEPTFEGEWIPQMLVTLGPLIGFGIMLIKLPGNMRRTQAKHFFLLLLFIYPFLSIWLLSEVGGPRPKLYQDSASLPPIGTRMPTPNPNSQPPLRPSSSSEQGAGGVFRC
ncbi:hypothetical protein [Hymenobacter volaticus]|uniref:Uncharacterized protein n=1 Tax=Hymenobacter volaticus TaxID=2932254 RepID=A0ABY4GAY7_9BACT|nr:hypothetical protein [Hymenobacter volaticus]UOQ67729.1 hypothetical protein MUN86_07665 [Hymenobacter volaticus]